MRIRTLLNKFEYLKSFVYEKEYIEEQAHLEVLIVEISSRKNSKPVCSVCGVRIEQVPWAKGKSPITSTYAQFLARWAKKLSWSEVADAFKTTWYHVFIAVKQIVEYGLGNFSISPCSF